MPRDWSRRRVGFLIACALALLFVLWWAGTLVMPFAIAAILAYALTPPVVWCERRGIPRAVSILLVYAVFLVGVVGAGVSLTPRVYREAVQLRDELPGLARTLSETWATRVERWIEHTGNGSAPEPNVAKGPAIVVTPLPEGGFGVDLRADVEVVADGHRRWRLQRAGQERVEVSDWFEELVADMVEKSRDNVVELARVSRAIIGSTIRGVFLVFMMLMCAGYLIHTREEVLGFIRQLASESSRLSVDRFLRRLDRNLSGVIRGQLLICLINGVLSGVGFWFLGLKYWPLLTLIAGALSILPIFGALLSTVPAVLIAFGQSPWIALWTLLWIIFIHQIEANVLNPKVIGTVARLHPVLVIFALLLGERSFGLGGALLALPVLGIVRTVFTHFRAELLGDVADSLPPIPPLVAQTDSGRPPDPGVDVKES